MNLKGYTFMTTIDLDDLAFDALATNNPPRTIWTPPTILNPNDPDELATVKALAAAKQLKVVQRINSWATDISRCIVPHRDMVAERRAVYDDVVRQKWGFGRWIVIDGHLVQIPARSMFNRIRTTRNNPLIPTYDQEKLGEMHIVVFGQSVGSWASLIAALNGIVGTLTIADFDELGPSNLNRIPAGIMDIGNSKLVVTGNQVAKMNPYVVQIHFYEGATPEVLKKIAALNPRPTLIVEAIDGMKPKLEIHEWAREHGFALMMPTDVGRVDRHAVLVSRFDLDRNTPLFDGNLSPELIEFIRSTNRPMTWEEMGGCAIEIIGEIPPDLAAGLYQVHYTITGIPQLGSVAATVGAAAGNLMEAIGLGRDVRSGWWSVLEAARLNSAWK